MFPLNQGMIKINEDKIKPFKIILNLSPTHISFPYMLPIFSLPFHIFFPSHPTPRFPPIPPPPHTHLTPPYTHPYQSLHPPPFNPYQSLPSFSSHPIPTNPTHPSSLIQSLTTRPLLTAFVLKDLSLFWVIQVI